MDFYSKLIFTIIALSLGIIAAQALAPKEAHAAILGGPTYGDLMDLSKIKDSSERSKEHRRIIRSIPLVRVQGGDIEVSGSVDVN